MNGILRNLLRLQTLEFSDKISSAEQAEIGNLRTVIPQPILGHYDRLRTRGKKGIAVVRNQVCTGCQMRLPIGTINTLMQATDIQLCDTCGRYLHLPKSDEQPAQSAAVDAPKAKPAAKPRKRRAATQA